MNRWILSRPARAAARIFSRMGSELRKFHARACYPGVAFIGHVQLERGVRVSAIRSGRVLISDCFVSRNTVITAGDGGLVEVRADFIGPNSVIVAQDHVSIGDGSKLAEMVVVRDANHDHTVALDQMRFVSRPVSIGADVWLGARATVLAGVTLGDHVSVGAGAVVISSFEQSLVVVGVPARALRLEP